MVVFIISAMLQLHINVLNGPLLIVGDQCMCAYVNCKYVQTGRLRGKEKDSSSSSASLSCLCVGRPFVRKYCM